MLTFFIIINGTYIIEQNVLFVDCHGTLYIILEKDVFLHVGDISCAWLAGS